MERFVDLLAASFAPASLPLQTVSVLSRAFDPQTRHKPCCLHSVANGYGTRQFRSWKRNSTVLSPWTTQTVYYPPCTVTFVEMLRRLCATIGAFAPPKFGYDTSSRAREQVHDRGTTCRARVRD